MSEAPYGLKRQPFKAAASGADLFVGPQTAKVMQSTRKALSSPEAVVAVIGPAGTGKTTLVKRALGTISGDKQVIHVARMQLVHDEVLELLLEAVGTTDIPASKLKQFRLFQQHCVAKANAGVRTIILVEDAVRIGEDALAELEALTAPDGLDNGGANLVLMGDPSLGKLMYTESLVRLRQRLRLYQKVQPLAPAEMQGYLKHGFRMAGGEFDLLFDEEAGTLFHSLSAGIPRIVNNLVDSVLSAAAEDGLARIDLETIRQVAEEQYGLTAEVPEAPREAPAAAAKPAPNAAPGPGPAANSPQPTPASPQQDRTDDPQKNAAAAGASAKGPRGAAPPSTPVADAGNASVSKPASPAEAAPAVPKTTRECEPAETPTGSGASSAATADSGSEPLELVEDTLPDLAILAPEIAGSAARKTSGDSQDIPTLFSSQTVDTGKRVSATGDHADDRRTPGERAQPDGRTPTPPREQGQPVKRAAATPAAQSKAEPLPKAAETTPTSRSKPGQPAKPAGPAPAPQSTQDQRAQAAAAKAASTAQAPPEPRKQAAGTPAARPASENQAAGQQAAAPAADTAKAAAPQAKTRAAGKKAAAGNAATEPKAAPRPAAEGKNDDTPDWDRDPTLAELRPDFDALEQAMAEFAEADAVAAASAQPAEKKPQENIEVELRDATVPCLPEITLDSAIEERIAEESAARDRDGGPRPGDDVPIEAIAAEDAGAETPKDGRKPLTGAAQPEKPATPESTRADDELERIAAGLARARTIEDVDDKMAETLFGEEFSAIAAQIAANPPPEYLEAMAESSSPAEQKPAHRPAAKPGPKPELKPEPRPEPKPEPRPEPRPEPKPEPRPEPRPEPKPDAKSGADKPNSEFERQFMEVYGEEALNVDIGTEERHAGLDLSASQRLATVRALNADGSGNTGSASSAKSNAASSGPPPAPIEDQITTSLTQTMRTLQGTSRSANDDDDDDGEKKGGFLRRFRRS